MPRAFTDAERERVRALIVAAAADQFGRFGYRKANVAGIASAAGIGKGSVYMFFDSKAALFLAAATEAEAEQRAALLEALRQEAGTGSSRDRVRCFLRHAADAMVSDPLLAVMTDPEEAAALFRDIPPSVMADLKGDDDAFFSEISEHFREEGVLADIDPGVFACLPRALFALTLQRDMIGAERFPAVMELVVDALSDALALEPGGSKAG